MDSSRRHLRLLTGSTARVERIAERVAEAIRVDGHDNVFSLDEFRRRLGPYGGPYPTAG